MNNTFRPEILARDESDKLEDSACLAVVMAVLDEEYVKPFNKQDEARLDEAWTTFEEITGIRTSFTPEEIEKRVKTIIEKSRA